MDYHPVVIDHTNLPIAYLATGEPSLEGHMGYQYNRSWDDADNSEVNLIRKRSEKAYPGVVQGTLYFNAWEVAMIHLEAVARAIKKYGVDNLTGDNLRMILESGEEFDTHGLSGAITYSSWDHQGSHSIRLVRCEGGKTVPVTKFKEGPPLTPEQRYPDYWIKR